MISAADFDDVFGPRARQNRAASSTAPLEPGALQAEDEEVEAALVLREGVDHRADDYPSPSRRRLRDLRRIARSRVNQHLTRSGVIGQSLAKASNTSSPARSVAHTPVARQAARPSSAHPLPMAAERGRSVGTPARRENVLTAQKISSTEGYVVLLCPRCLVTVPFGWREAGCGECTRLGALRAQR